VKITGFNNLGQSNARILILGSMPSEISLQKQRYYAHPRNVFWRIMAELFHQSTPLSYQQGVELLERQGIAVWDVLKSCERQGSLDAAINKQSIQVNDFSEFFMQFTQIKKVYFNGATAERLYKKSVWKTLAPASQTLEYMKLPSTSPAYAAMSYEQKLAVWAVIKHSDND